jgi:DNA invertase Pin-like site-specific DNA recombinase
MSQYVIYCRKSSESEERQVLSIESQIKELKEFAKRSNLQVSEILNESQSAKSPGRPVFNEMMKKIYKGQLKGVICWKLDRLARNPIDGSAVVWALDQEKISEILTPHGSFKNNSSDKFLMQIEFGMAKKYVDDLSDNVKRGNRAKLERGWLPGLPPLGYLNEPKERTIIKDPERYPLIRKMWELVLKGVFPSKIFEIANEKWGFRSRTFKKSGGKPLSTRGLYKIFGNPFYYGLIERKEGVFQGKHEPLITEEEFWKAQEILGRRGRQRPKNHEFAFTGLIRCGECGCMITAEEKINRYGYHYAYYRCTKKKRGVPCRQKYINLKDLEKQISEYLVKIHVPERLLRIAIEYLKEEGKEENEKYSDIQRSLEKAYDNCQKKIDNLNQMRLKDLIDDEEYVKEKKSLLEEKIRLEESLKDGNDNGKKSIELTEKAFVFASRAKDRFQNGLLEDKRTILQGLGSNLLLKDKKLLIQIEKPLILIEKSLNGVNDGNNSLEPQISGTYEPKTELRTSNFLSWYAVVEDVRTFYEINREANIAELKR